jgi:hypothetical protein
VATHISVYTTGEKPNNRLYVQPLGSAVQQPSAKYLLGQNQAPTLGIKSWFLAIVWTSRHPSLPHSPSIKLP